MTTCDPRCDQCPPDKVWCTLCVRAIPIDECVEVEAGILKHESANGYIHIIS